MSASPSLSLAGPRTNPQDAGNFLFGRAWWSRFATRCSADPCPNRGRLWPSWLRLEHGLYFEGRWYCEPSCLEPVLEFRVRHLLSGFLSHKRKNHRVPLGLLLVQRGVISADQRSEEHTSELQSHS